MAKLVVALGSGSSGSNPVQVQVLFQAQNILNKKGSQSCFNFKTNYTLQHVLLVIFRFIFQQLLVSNILQKGQNIYHYEVV